MEKTIFNISWSIQPLRDSKQPIMFAKVGRNAFDTAFADFETIARLYYRTDAIKSVKIEIKDLNTDKILIDRTYKLDAYTTADQLIFELLKTIAANALKK